MFDLHVHAAPDIGPRIGDDLDVVRRYAAAGYAGCVLKGHYASTVGRALATGRSTGLAVFGGLALNRHVGGVNPAAVTAELLQGARVIWMPTADAHTQRTANLPRLSDQRPALGDVVYAVPPVSWANEGATRQVVELIAEFDAVLATGHLSSAEVSWLLPVARAAGVRRVLLTHPSYTVPAMTAATARELSEGGALVEVTAYQLLHQPGMTDVDLAGFVREVGIERVVLASDAGQPDSPPPPEALAMLVDRLARQGLDPGALRAAASETPQRLVTP
jgi:hypothetical protein